MNEKIEQLHKQEIEALVKLQEIKSDLKELYLQLLKEKTGIQIGVLLMLFITIK